MEKPLTPQEYQQKYGVPVNRSSNFTDASVRASIGYETSMFAPTNPAFDAANKQSKKGNMVTRLLGLDPAVDVFSRRIARSPVGAAITGTDVEANREFIEAPTGSEFAGAVLQTAATAVAPAIAPVGLGGAMVAGGALGYAYDVGSDLATGRELEDSLAPGVGTAAGVIAPPVLKGVSAGIASLLGRTSAQQVPKVTSGLSETLQTGVGAVKQTANDAAGRVGRVIERGRQGVTDAAEKAQRIKEVPTNARPAVRVNINNEIIDLATQSNPQTQQAMRQMVEIAEQGTGKAGTGPGRVAADSAVKQLQVITQAKKDIGTKIGEASKALPQAQNISTAPSVQALDGILSQNGIIKQADGSFLFQNKSITPEQQNVVRNLYQLATQDQTLSAQQIHQMDQLFSKLQRQANVIDKVDNIFVEVPTSDGKTTTANLFKVFRDVFGKQLDELSPEMRSLNSEYRKLTNLVDDIETGIAKTPGFESLSGENFAESGLRQMFGRGVKSDQLVELYDIMDSTSRSLGYDGARADDLYRFAIELNRIYPENVPPTSFEGGISTSLSNVLSRITGAGQITPADEQAAIRALVGLQK
jgi:hypothetical protein